MPLLSLKKLTVTNFRAVTSTVEVDFDQPPGLYFVAGRNESRPRLGANDAGKSTLFCEALSWLLQARTSRSNRPGADIVNWYADGNTAGVTGVFVLDGVTHVLERYRNPSRLTLDGRTVEQRDIDQLLPLSDTALRRTLLIDQFGTMFMGLRPEEKSRIFSETLSLDKWIKASDGAGRKVTDTERAIQRLEQELAVTTGTLAEVTDQREAAVDCETKFEIEQLAAIRRLRLEVRDAEAARAKSEAVLNAARAEFAEFSGDDLRELEDYRATERKLIRTIATTEQDAANGAEKIVALQRELRRYTDAKGVCPECGQEVSDEHIAEKAAGVRKRIKEARVELAEHSKAFAELPAELEAVRVAISQFEQALAGYQKAQSAVSVAAGQSIHDTREMHRLNKLLKETTEQDNPFNDQCDKLDARLTELRDTRKRQRSELNEARRLMAVYVFWQNGFREIRLDQIDTTLMELELAANRHSESLGLDDWEIQFATERETASGSLSHKFTVYLFPPGQDKPVDWENYAGGVSQRWQLAVTSALAEILLARAGIDTDFEILDECSTHLSREGIEDLLSCLRNRARELNRRIYFIDHHMLDHGAFDGVCTVARTNDGVTLEWSGGV
jgi:DNA repair exonuclease SbcCD ATPase subunit